MSEYLKRKFKDLSDSDISNVLKECNDDVYDAYSTLQKLQTKKLKNEVRELRIQVNSLRNENKEIRKENNEIRIENNKIREENTEIRKENKEIRKEDKEIRNNFLKSNQEKEEYKTLQSSEFLKNEVAELRIQVNSLRNENKEIWNYLKREHNKLGSLGKGKEYSGEELNLRDETLHQKLKSLHLDGLSQSQIESKIVVALYEVDTEDYGFILADFVYKRLMMFYPILYALTKNNEWTHDEWTPDECTPSPFEIISDYIQGNFIGQFDLPDATGIIEMHSLALCCENVENVENVKKLKDHVKVWLEQFKNLKTVIRRHYIKEKACDEVNTDDSASEVSGVQIYGSHDDTKYSAEAPWMRYYASEKGLLGKRKEVLLNLQKEFQYKCAFIIDEYNVSVLEPLRLKLKRHLREKSVWELMDVKVLCDSGKVAKNLLLSQDMDPDVTEFSKLDDAERDEIVERIEDIREWVEFWVADKRFAGDADRHDAFIMEFYQTDT